MNLLKKKPIHNLTLTECYELAKLGYIIIKHNDTMIVWKG